jgi:hypothetical protein
MKVKSFREEIRSNLMGSSTEYCCYCYTVRGCSISCCQENHFVMFQDLDDETQNEMINIEVEEYEAWSKT